MSPPPAREGVLWKGGTTGSWIEARKPPNRLRCVARCFAVLHGECSGIAGERDDERAAEKGSLLMAEG